MLAAIFFIVMLKAIIFCNFKNMNTDLVKYYKDRAKEYEKIYSKPERQEELITASKILQEIFNQKKVFEIACGTGYWTERIAKTAHSIIATDINEAVLEIAKQKEHPLKNVKFQVEDIFNTTLTTKHESLFAGFIWSHIKKQDLPKFVKALRSMIETNATVVIMDNNYVEGSNHPITDTDESGNTFQTRKLDDGSSHFVLKNFPTENYFKEAMKEFSGEIQFINLKYYWIALLSNCK